MLLFLQAVPYAPCPGCVPKASVNDLVQFAMNTVAGNREWVSDAIVIISTELYKPAEVVG